MWSVVRMKFEGDGIRQQVIHQGEAILGGSQLHPRAERCVDEFESLQATICDLVLRYQVKSLVRCDGPATESFVVISAGLTSSGRV